MRDVMMKMFGVASYGVKRLMDDLDETLFVDSTR